MTWKQASAKSHRVKTATGALSSRRGARLLPLALIAFVLVLAVMDTAAATADTALTKERLHATTPESPLPGDEPAGPEEGEPEPEPEPEPAPDRPQDGGSSSTPYRGRPTPQTGNGSDDKEEGDAANDGDDASHDQDGEQAPGGNRELGHLLLSQVCVVSSRSCSMDGDGGDQPARRASEPETSIPSGSPPSSSTPATASVEPQSDAGSAPISAPDATSTLQDFAKSTVTRSSLLVLLAWTLFIASPGRSRTARINLGEVCPVASGDAQRTLTARREETGAAAPAERRPTRGLSP